MTIKQVFGGHVPVKIWTSDLDEQATQQLMNLGTLPFIHKHVAVMPDAHGGLGSTIGSVIPTKGAIIPAAVGVDLGCGMMAYQLTINARDLPDDLHTLRCLIENAIPHGRTANGGRADRGAWKDTPDTALKWWANYGIEKEIPDILERHPDLLKGHVNTHRHLGTLGTGNHFIEISLDENNVVWIMLHSGSRGIGNRIGSYFIKRAKKEMERWHIQLPDKDLAYLVQGAVHFDDYVRAVGWAQKFASHNRLMMMSKVLEVVEIFLDRKFDVTDMAINCHHNYIAIENHFGSNVWITRKGAIRARKGELGIIPGSMGAKSFIVKGKGEAQSFNSCSHGAGRAMSRTEARRRYTSKDLAAQTAGVECPKDDTRVDEIPSAYKDIEVVMANQEDLVEVVHTLHAVVNVKG